MGTEELENEVERFTEEQLAQDRADARGGVKNPSFTELKVALTKHGPEGILESARHLEPEQYDELAKLVRKAPRPVHVRPRKSR